MRATAREREIERAWALHEPLRARVPPDARRAVARFKERISPDADKIKHTYQSPPFRALLNDWARKGAVGRERAKRKIVEMLAPACVDDVGGPLMLMWAEPRGQMIIVDHPSFAQNCVLAVAAVIERVGRGVRDTSFPVVEVPDHALGRMFQRCPGVDAAAALSEAAVAFLRANRRAVEAARLTAATVCLPAGPGVLLALAIAGPDLEGKPRLISRASTWIAAEQAESDQRPIAAAIDPAQSVLQKVLS